MILLILIAVHFLADFPLQGEWMAKEKYKAFKEQLGTVALIAHGFIQALTVSLTATMLGYDFTLFFIVIGSTHILIDYGKIKGMYGVIVDQLLHFAVILILLVKNGIF